MPRGPRRQPGGVVFHVLNRGNERRTLFARQADYAAFVRVLHDTLDALPMRVLAYCLMPNHWHLVLWPEQDGDLGRFMQRLTVTHVRRWREHRRSVGLGHLYQGPYKSFPTQEDRHFLLLCRYVERNARRANLVTQAEDWRWSSLWQREQGWEAGHAPWPALAPWPVDRPGNWLSRVQQPETVAEAAALALSLRRGRPLGHGSWVAATAQRLSLTSTLRPRGRPRKEAPK